MMSRYYDFGLLFNRVIILNTALSYVIKLHGQYVFFSAVMLRSWCGITSRMMFPKGDGFVTTLVKIPCIKVNKGKIITTVDGTLIPS